MKVDLSRWKKLVAPLVLVKKAAAPFVSAVRKRVAVVKAKLIDTPMGAQMSEAGQRLRELTQPMVDTMVATVSPLIHDAKEFGQALGLAPPDDEFGDSEESDDEDLSDIVYDDESTSDVDEEVGFNSGEDDGNN